MNTASHDPIRLQFNKLADARSMLDRARSELVSLTKLGDLVTQEDVIKGAGKLVAAGLSPMGVAKLLSDMPDKGDAIQAWLVEHATALGQREAQLEPVLAAGRHALATSGMKTLLEHHFSQLGMATMPPSQSNAATPNSSNSLMPSSGASPASAAMPSGET